MKQLQTLHEDQRGMSMVAVILVGMIIAVIAVVMVSRSVSDLNQARFDRNWQRSLHVADAGIDHVLYQLSVDDTFSTGETPPAFATLAAEKAWALSIATDAGLPLSRVTDVTEGAWVIIKPDTGNAIYSVGFVPDREVGPSGAAADNIRVLRVAYDFAPFVPVAAFLSDGDIHVKGSTNTDGVTGHIHANGDVTSQGGGSDVAGTVTAAGNADLGGFGTIGDVPNSGSGKPPIFVPEPVMEDYFDLAEFILCPDGTIRAGPSYPDAATIKPSSYAAPCSGQLLGDVAGTGIEYQGWSWMGYHAGSKGGQWRYNENDARDGSYYIHAGSVDISGNPGDASNPWNVTIAASAVPGTDTCATGIIGGDIELRGTPVAVPYNEPALFVARRDISMSGNAGGDLSGVLWAYEQIEMTGSARLVGSVIVNDACDTPGSMVNQTEYGGNAEIIYDGGAEVPGGDQIRITHWNEL